MFEYHFIVGKSYETKLKMTPFCRDWPSVCWTILKVNKMVKTIVTDNLIVDHPWAIDKIRKYWIILLILILATIKFIIRRRRNNKQKLESRLRQEEIKKYFDKIIDEMQELTEKDRILDSSSEEEPKNVDEFYSFSDSGESGMTLKPEQLNEVRPRNKFTNKAVRFQETNIITQTPDYNNVLVNFGDGPKQLNDLNSTKGVAANRTKKSASKSTKKSQIPNITAPKPGAKICFKSNLPQSQPVSLKVTERPIWRI